MRQYSGIGVLDKAMTVLHAVAEQPCVLSDLCDRTGLPRATAHRLAVGLETHQLLPRLRETTDESVQVYRRDGDRRVCVASAEPLTGLRDTVPVGAVLPMTRGSGAKVLAAWADVHTQRALLADASYTERQLAEIRKRGWAQSVAEREPGVASISAPIRDSSGVVIAAISVSGPVDRIGRRPGVRWAADLLAAAEAIHKRL